MRIADQLMYVTARIESETANGDQFTGSSFFYELLTKAYGSNVPSLITNKHVVRGAKKGRIRFNLAGADGKPLPGKSHVIEIGDFESRWIMHPSESIDLCALPVVPLFQDAEKTGLKFFYVSLNSDLVPTPSETEQLAAVEDVVMVGYPNGIWDNVNNTPTVRRGITATPPRLNYQGRSEFVVDIAAFPGSSGSPVILMNEGSFSTANGIVIGSRVKLLGILYAGPIYNAQGEVKAVPIPQATKSVTVTGIPNNLGYVIKSSEIKALEDKLAALIAGQPK